MEGNSRYPLSRYALKGALPGVHFNERLHWICWRTGLEEEPKVLVAFDLADEIFREVQLPTSSDDYDFDQRRMVVLGGYLCSLVWLLHREEIDVRMMTKYGVREPWTKCTIVNPMIRIVHVLCLSAEDEFMMYTNEMIGDVNGIGIQEESDGAKLVVYNTKKETLRDMVVSGIPTSYTWGDNYIETVVSPRVIG